MLSSTCLEFGNCVSHGLSYFKRFENLQPNNRYNNHHYRVAFIAVLICFRNYHVEF